MIKRFLFLTAAVLSITAAAYEKSEYKVRPWEIINGLKPYSKALWQADNGDISKWRASNGGVLSETSITKLWGERLQFLLQSKEQHLLL